MNTDKTSNYKLGDFDVWYEPCEKCGYDTGKSEVPKDGNKTCWKCGNFVRRDYSARALKKNKINLNNGKLKLRKLNF